MGIAAIIGLWLLALLPSLSNRPWSTPLSLLGSEGAAAWMPMVFAALLSGMQQTLAVRWWFAGRRTWAVMTQVAVVALVICGATPPLALIHDVAFTAYIVFAIVSVVLPWLRLHQRRPLLWFIAALLGVGLLMWWPLWGLGGVQRAGLVWMFAALSWQWHITALRLPEPLVVSAALRLRRRRPQPQVRKSESAQVIAPQLAPRREDSLSMWSEVLPADSYRYQQRGKCS